jgi:formate/nitrite transporter FocA (FNT family)
VLIAGPEIGSVTFQSAVFTTYYLEQWLKKSFSNFSLVYPIDLFVVLGSQLFTEQTSVLTIPVLEWTTHDLGVTASLGIGYSGQPNWRYFIYPI